VICLVESDNERDLCLPIAADLVTVGRWETEPVLGLV
jgi:hypothetical protein